ncbi:[acyl-carrier-protein] S-malonyltransferase, partial [Burkholderia pseudomallei]
PVGLAGHSLGDYSALPAARVFDFRSGLEIVKRRGELFASAGRGAMAAVVGVSGAELGPRERAAGVRHKENADIKRAEQP